MPLTLCSPTQHAHNSSNQHHHLESTMVARVPPRNIGGIARQTHLCCSLNACEVCLRKRSSRSQLPEDERFVLAMKLARSRRGSGITVSSK